MSAHSIPGRLKAIQRHLGLRADGIPGPATLSAIERRLGIGPEWSLRASRRSLEALVGFEIGSEARYRRELDRPYWPGGNSGVTIGIGYDLGYHTKSQVEADLNGAIPDEYLWALLEAVGCHGVAAEDEASNDWLCAVSIPLEVAKRVFYTKSLPRWAKVARRTFPGVEHLGPNAQGALLSLVFNRGPSLKGARRQEMAEIRRILGELAADLERSTVVGGTRDWYAEIAGQIRAMKRLWEGQGLGGLLKRREAEARLVEDAEPAPAEEVVLL